jgi:hypothetical protein
MTLLFSSRIASYLEVLTATNPICVDMGATFIVASNLFDNFEPDRRNLDTVSIISYGGGPTEQDKVRQNPSVQIRVKCTSRQKALKVQQSIINTLNRNTLRGYGKMFAINSAPILLEVDKGGRYTITVSNFDCKHVKV